MDLADSLTASLVRATRKDALAQLEAFAPCMGEPYATRRNFDLGPSNRANVSGLSPYHSHRLLTEEETVKAALDGRDLEEVRSFVEEVYWRTYFKGWLEQHPEVWSNTKRAVLQDAEDLTSERRKAYERAMAGETGIAAFDAWAGELRELGYLHNHARMWFASIWVFTLKLPWTLGADFFLRHLLDGDAASNTLSWRWVAGLHTQGKTYLATPDNIERFTEGRFGRPDGLATEAAALDDDWNERSEPLPAPQEIDPSAPTLLLIHEDDLGIETLDLGGVNLVGTAAITVTDDRSPFGASEQAKHFTIEAVEDALNRADDTLPGEAQKVLSAQGAGDLARELGAEQIVYPYAPVGPVRDRIDEARTQWEKSGLKAAWILRPYDQAAWPHCGKGYFALKKTIPSLIDGLR